MAAYPEEGGREVFEVSWESCAYPAVDLKDSFKCGFQGDQVAVLAPPHGHVPLHRPCLPGALCRGSRRDLPALPRVERSLWPHLEEFVRMTEVPIGLPGAQRQAARTLSPEPWEAPEPEEFRTPPPRPRFDAEAALEALRRERRSRSPENLRGLRGRPLGSGDPLLGAGLGQGPTSSERNEVSEASTEMDRPEHRGRDRSREGRSPEPSGQVPPLPSHFAHAEALILASLRPRVPSASSSTFVMRPPVVEFELPSRPERERVAPRRPSVRRASTELRSAEKLGKLLVAHYEVRIARKQADEVRKTAKLMRVVLGIEEEKPESILEGISVLQNAQKLIGVVGPEAGEATEVHRSRVTLRTLALLDRQVKARSSLADAARALEELTSNEEKLLVDMVDAPSAVKVLEHPESEEMATLLGPPKKLSSGAVKHAWEVVHQEAADWLPTREKEKDVSSVKKGKNSGKEESAAAEQARQAHAMAVHRFAKSEAAGALSDDLGEDSLRRAARIEYAIKAGEAVVEAHPELSKAWQLAHDLRAHRAYRYCLGLMKSIQPSLGSAGRVANEIDQVVQEASTKFGVPKDHKYMEEARRLVLQARSEEAKVKRKEDAARRAKTSA